MVTAGHHNNQQISQRRAQLLPRGVGQFASITPMVSGRGAKVTDAEGNQIIDLAGGIGVLNVGHCHPKVVQAIQNQAAKLTHTCIQVGTYEPYLDLCEKLCTLFPHGDRGTKAFLVNSGAEAVENAVKVARQATGRSAVIAYTEAFHGRTLMALSLTSKAGYKVNCGPYAPEVYRLPFPNWFRIGDGLETQAFVDRELSRFRRFLVDTVPARQVAAVIIEPVQGEGGFVPAPFGYMRGLRSLCDEFGILLICDEVQSGFARTGKWSAYQHAGITPDISTWAKSMGGGLPIAAVVGRAEVMDACAPGTLGGTYGGNPIACAAALAAIEVIAEEKLCERAVVIGKRIAARFAALQEQHPHVIGEVRGLGAMVAMELVFDGNPDKPAGDLAKSLCVNCLKRGVLIITAGATANIIRVLCPLVITDEDLDHALDVVDEEFGKCVEAIAPPSRHVVSAGSR